MAPVLVNADSIAEALGLSSAKAAQSLMSDWRVPFTNLGPGRGRGLRWRWADVEKAIKKHTVTMQEAKPKKRTKKDPDDIFSLGSVKEMKAAIMKSRLTKAA